MKNQETNEIPIEPIGSYFELDDQGYVINPASLDKIQEKWRPVIDDIIEGYKKHLGDHLKNVYIRGSVAKGKAIDMISDIDTFCCVNVPKDTIDTSWTKDLQNEIEEKYKFVEGVELDIRNLSKMSSQGILLNQSVCVYGESLPVPKMKPGKEMMLHLPYLEERLSLVAEKLDEADSEQKIKWRCIWFMKDMLRSGFELTMERSQRYTRDLYPCYAGFSEYYPDKEPLMREILRLALNPTGNKDEIYKIRDAFVLGL